MVAPPRLGPPDRGLSPPAVPARHMTRPLPISSTNARGQGKGTPRRRDTHINQDEVTSPLSHRAKYPDKWTPYPFPGRSLRRRWALPASQTISYLFLYLLSLRVMLFLGQPLLRPDSCGSCYRKWSWRVSWPFSWRPFWRNSLESALFSTPCPSSFLLPRRRLPKREGGRQLILPWPCLDESGQQGAKYKSRLVKCPMFYLVLLRNNLAFALGLNFI